MIRTTISILIALFLLPGFATAQGEDTDIQITLEELPPEAGDRVRVTVEIQAIGEHDDLPVIVEVVEMNESSVPIQGGNFGMTFMDLSTSTITTTLRAGNNSVGSLVFIANRPADGPVSITVTVGSSTAHEELSADAADADALSGPTDSDPIVTLFIRDPVPQTIQGEYYFGPSMEVEETATFTIHVPPTLEFSPISACIDRNNQGPLEEGDICQEEITTHADGSATVTVDLPPGEYIYAIYLIPGPDFEPVDLVTELDWNNGQVDRMIYPLSSERQGGG